MQVQMTQDAFTKTQFLNVDLIIYSRSDLHPLITGIEKHLHVLYLGKENRSFKACVELARVQRKTPDAIIRGFCSLIQKLPASERRYWNQAKSRIFDIGIEFGGKGSHCWFALAQQTIASAADVNAQIAVTIYGPRAESKNSLKRRRTASLK